MLNRVLNWFGLTKKGFLSVVAGCAIMAFVVVNIHMPSKITEGGILGLTLFMNKVVGLNPVFVSPVLDVLCFGLGASLLGFLFLRKTALASMLFASFYAIFLKIGLVIPSMYNEPLLAAVLAGIGIGVGCGMVISQGGAAGGDDALALVISKKTGFGISIAYLFTDVTILLLSLVYIPFGRIIFSLITTMVSSFIIGQFEVKIPAVKIPSIKIPKPEIQIERQTFG